MKNKNINLVLCLVPLFVAGWGIFSFLFYDTFYSRAIDPEYPYLINGLNVALLEFKRIGHFDHPGTPFQVFCGVIIRITHFFSATDKSIAQDVFLRPDYYLMRINIFLVAIQAGLLFLLAWVGRLRDVKTRSLLILQVAFLCNFLLIDLFCRVIPERWIIILAVFFLIIYLQYGYKHRNPKRFALWCGVIMGMGMATKFNFLPLTLLPFLLIDANKNRLLYVGSGVASFFVFIAPIITKFNNYWRFITGIAKHDGIYGQGKERMFNPETMKANFLEVFHLAPELLFIIILLIIILVINLVSQAENKGKRKNILFSLGMLLIVFLQIIMVSKHFKNTYLIPIMSFYGMIFFWTDNFFTAFSPSKRIKYVLPTLLLFFVVFTAKNAFSGISSESGRKENREQICRYVTDSLPKNTLWFVEPTWESAPYLENGIVYGLSYCHRTQQYLPELMQLNPHIITFEGVDNLAKRWRIEPIYLDSLVTTSARIHIYSTAGRNAHLLTEMLTLSAQRMEVEMQTDTLFSQPETRSHIIVMYNPHSQKKGEILSLQAATDRETQIQETIKTIRNDIHWLENVTQKAKARNIPLDTMLRLDAIWVLENP